MLNFCGLYSYINELFDAADLQGDSLTFGTGANVLIFGVSEIIWGLKFQCLKCAICDLKFLEGEIIWGLTFLVSHCPSHFLSIKLFLETGQLIIWGL